MKPDQPQQEQPVEPPTNSVYPIPSKGNLSDDHSSYNKPVKWAGVDPDKSMRATFIVFLIILGLLFIFAVKSLSGGKFWF